jgi:hypothetical protein
MGDKMKRKRGGQPGNQNARKHGFYSANLTPEEICELLNITNLKGTDREMAVLRIKLKSVLATNPGNRRVLMEAAKLVVKEAGAKYHLDREDRNRLKKVVRSLWNNIPVLSNYQPDNTKQYLQNESNLYSQTNRHTKPVQPTFTLENT